jgi:hypothetical protein
LSAWARQFVTPSIEGLLSELPGESRPGVHAVRTWLAESIKDKPKLIYYNSSWRWAEQRTLHKPHSGALEEVFVILEPDRPRVAISCQRRFFEQHAISELHKGVQADVQEGVCVGRVVWVECALESDSDAEGICSLLDTLYRAK